MLSQALKGSVDSVYTSTRSAPIDYLTLIFPEHARAFNNSLAHHASLLNHLGVAQTQIADTRTSLQEAKDSLSSKRADLVQLWSRGQILDEMMRILDQMCVCLSQFMPIIFAHKLFVYSEHLKAVPDVLETLMSEKRLLQASVLLVRSLKMINKSDMVEIGAVTDLRSYLNGQEAVSSRVHYAKNLLMDFLGVARDTGR